MQVMLLQRKGMAGFQRQSTKNWNRPFKSKKKKLEIILELNSNKSLILNNWNKSWKIWRQSNNRTRIIINAKFQYHEK